jgi:hypothetical protein
MGTGMRMIGKGKGMGMGIGIALLPLRGRFCVVYNTVFTLFAAGELLHSSINICHLSMGKCIKYIRIKMVILLPSKYCEAVC